MVYLEYERYKARFYAAQKMFEDALLEKERLFTKTQPNAITYDRDPVQTSPNPNILDDYVIALETERIDERLEPYRVLLKDRECLLDLKERELRKSPDRYDKIYVCKYLDGMSTNRITKALNYSRAQVYRILKQISKKIKYETK
jgi:hypothetical protein